MCYTIVIVKKTKRIIMKDTHTINTHNLFERTPLMQAILDVDEGLVSTLLKDPDLDINARNTHIGDTALMYAAKSGNINIVNLLLNMPNIEKGLHDSEGKTASICYN
jgi:ankyrin repeat protein